MAYPHSKTYDKKIQELYKDGKMREVSAVLMINDYLKIGAKQKITIYDKETYIIAKRFLLEIGRIMEWD